MRNRCHRRLEIVIPSELHEGLAKIARDSGTTLRQLAIKALSEMLENRMLGPEK